MSKVLNPPDQNSLLEVENDVEFNQSNCFSVFFFTWIYPLLGIGKNKPLIQTDLVKIDNRNCMCYSHQTFIKFFNQSNLKATLYNAFKCQFFTCVVFYLIVSALFLCQPIITQVAQRFFMYEDPADKPTMAAMLEFVGIQFAYMASLSLIKPFQLFQSSILSVRIQGALQQEILSKTLKFPIARSLHYSTGELINMLQVDITQASNYYYNAIILFTCPLQLICAFVVMVITLQKDAISLAVGAVVQAIVGLLFGYYFGRVQRKYMIAKDVRMKAVDEALIHAKQVKLNCLEDFFDTRIKHWRSDELHHLKIQVLMLIFITFLQGFIGILNWECIFFFSNPLNFAIVNIMIQNYQMIVGILSGLPQQLKSYQMSQNSINRIENYLQQKECIKIPNAIEQDNIAVNMEQAQYNWAINDQMNENVIEAEEENQVNQQQQFQIDINLKIKKGQYVAFVGSSASGKSTILKSILGETYYKTGKITVNGTISVATQEPWIISGSIKKNITFMNQFDGVKYKKIIKICGLERDLSLFKNGDDTILSEKGDNLSGGQQKRINLARAVYNDADIYLLDDPMSALDIKVKYQIYQQCIQGYLKDKTRILFTNSLSNLQECDMIYMVENGQIVKQGTFAQLIGASQDGQLYSQKEVIDLQFEEEHYKTSNNEQDARASLIQQEDQEKGNISKSVQLQVFKYLGQYWCILCTLLYFVIVLTCQLFGNSVMSQQGLTDAEYKRMGEMYYPLIQLPIVLSICFQQLYYLIKGLITSRLLHNNVINSLLNASYTKFYNTILIGRLMNRLSKDVYNIDLLFPTEIQNLTVTLTTLLLPLFACFLYLNYAALPLLLIFFIVMIYLTMIYYRCLREITRIESVSKSPVFSFFQQIVRGITYARACLPFDKIIINQQRNVDVDLGNQINLYGFQYWFQSLAGVITNVFQGILFIICFLFPGKTQQMTNLVLNQMQTVSQLLLNATVSYGNIQMYLISFERCLHLANKIELEERFVPMVTPSGDPIPEPEKKSEQNIVLDLKNCTFQYRSNSKSVLSTINFKLHKGEKIGVVGRTGAGKSSIILALTQVLEQTEGHIEIEGKNVNLYSINEIRQKYAIIPQDPIIFMGTLKENLDPLNQFSEARILEVVEDCGLLQMQSFKQNGLQSEISLSGGNLSQGEKQLLNIVRCILEDKQIILVDEATANIDLQTEELVKQLFEKYFKSAAMLTIAHKVTTIMNSDKIMVINDGMITEFDDPQKLLSNPNSEFKQILDLIKQAEQL